MEELSEKSPQKISRKSVIIGLLMFVDIVCGMFLDSDGAVGWLSLGACLLTSLTALVLHFKWDDKMKEEAADEDN